MMGFGGYGNGGSYTSPPSSNLSASAPPFTLDRSPKPSSVPLVDLIEQSYSGPMNSSLNNWLLARAPGAELNPVPPPSNGYGYGGMQTVESSSTIVSASADPFCYGQSTDNVAKPYYPPYLSPPTHKDSPFVIPDQATYDWSSSSRVSTALDGSSSDYPERSLESKYGAEWGDGLWNGFVEWKHGKQGHGSLNSNETDANVPSMYENYMNPEGKIPKGLSRDRETSYTVDFLQMEDLGRSLNVEKLDENAFLGNISSFTPADYSRSVLGSLSGLAETQLQTPSLVFGPSSVSHQLHSSASSERLLKQRANEAMPILQSSTGIVIALPSVGCGSSGLSDSPFKIVNLGSDRKNFHSQSMSENKLAFDLSQLSTHLERDDPTSLTNKDFTANDTMLDALKEKSRPRISNSGHDGFSMDSNVNETISTVQESSEGVDHYNHGVDSPCWKGVPINHSSPFDATEVVPDLKKLEACNNINLQAKQGDKVSSQKLNESTTFHEVGYLEQSSGLPLTESISARDPKSDDVTKFGDHSETKMVQHSDDSHEYGSKSDIKNSQVMKQSLQEGEVVNKIIEEALQYCSSHLHIPVEHVVSRPVDTSCTKPITSTERPSTPTIDVEGLVNTIHNLSEFLLFHCAKGSCQLKLKDHTVVQSVIDNLSMCISKKAEEMASTQEPILSEKDACEDLGDLQKGSMVDTSEVTKRVGSIQALVDAHSARKENKLYPFSAGSDHMEDKTTQAFKKVLTENFNEEETHPQSLLYKNLWLEAEAALCSVNYRARYNRMKIEMESSKLLKSKDVHESSITTDLKKRLGSVVSPNSEAAEIMSPKDEGCSAPKSQGLSALSPSSHDDDVMARFQILRCRIENSSPNTPAHVDNPPSSIASPHSGNVAKVLPEAHEKKTSPKPETSIQTSSDLDANKDINDFDASVMARFQILKSRTDNFTSHSTEVHRPPQAEIKLPRFASQSTHWPVLGSIPEIGNSGVNPASESHDSHFAVSEFQMYHPHGQSHSAYRPENSLLQPGYDWEHVRKEDLGWQNR